MTVRGAGAGTAVGSLVVVLLVCLAGCTGGRPDDAPADRDATPPPAATSSAPPPLEWGPTLDEIAEARALVAAMPVEQAAGQVLVSRYRGTSPQAAASLVAELHLAGVILMGDNVQGPEQVRATADAVQQAHAATGRTWPAVVSVDQEGGRVARVGAPATEFPTLMTAGAALAGGTDDDVVRQATAASGTELAAMGFTWVFAPSVDATTGPDDPTIGSRSASSDPALAARVADAAVRGYADAGVVAVAKHYPGHGSVPADSHRTLPVQSAPLDVLRSRDLPPFTAAARAGVPAVMMSHVAVDALEPGVPASLSGAAYALLREETGFTGVAVTDALDMAAVTDRHGPAGAAVAALAAGADLLLMPLDVRAAHGALVAAVGSGQVPRERLDEAATRVVALMGHRAAATSAGTGTAAPTGAGSPVEGAVGTHSAQSYALSLAGATVVSGPCSGPLVGGAIQVVGGTSTDRERLASAARAAGLQVGSGDTVRLLGSPTGAGAGDVVVALDAPYGLGRSEGATARIALFGRTPDAFRAFVDVLTGRATATGRLPVEVAGVPVGSGCD